MRISVLLLAALFSPTAVGQEFQLEPYAGLLGGLAPTYRGDAQFWDDDNQVISAGVFAGMNLLSGPILTGIELSVSKDFAQVNDYESKTFRYSTNYPQYVSSMSTPGVPVPAAVVTTGSRPGGTAVSETVNYTYHEILARPALTGRLGVQVDNWTFYGKAGLGVSLYQQTNVADNTRSVVCTATATETRTTPIAGYGNQVDVRETGCIGPGPGTVTSTSSNSWQPNIVFGIGTEYEFGRYFARGEVEMTQVVYGDSMVRANGGLGIKF